MESLVTCGRDSSLRELFEAFYGRTFATVIVMVRNRDQAEDITQEAFIRAFLNLKNLREPGKFGSWVAAIATNMARDSMKKEKKYLLSDEPLEKDLANLSSGVEDALLAKEKKDTILKALGRLSPGHYQVIMLFYYHDQRIEDIAEMLEVETGTVKSRLHRAREKLKVLLKEMELKSL